MAICRLCGQDKKLCEAHIVPKSFFKLMKKISNDDFLYVHDAQLGFETRTRVGPRDNNILCADCDRMIGNFDNYFYNFFTKLNCEKYQKELGSYTYYEVPISQKEYLNTKLFFISLLYRASISNVSFTRNVDLGNKYEEIARDCILNKQDNKKFSLILMKINSKRLDPSQTMGNLVKHTIDSIRGYSICLNGYKIWIKVDNRTLGANLRWFEFKEGTTLFLADQFEKTTDFKRQIELLSRFKK